MQGPCASLFGSCGLSSWSKSVKRNTLEDSCARRDEILFNEHRAPQDYQRNVGRDNSNRNVFHVVNLRGCSCCSCGTCISHLSIITNKSIRTFMSFLKQKCHLRFADSLSSGQNGGKGVEHNVGGMPHAPGGSLRLQTYWVQQLEPPYQNSHPYKSPSCHSPHIQPREEEMPSE